VGERAVSIAGCGGGASEIMTGSKCRTVRGGTRLALRFLICVYPCVEINVTLAQRCLLVDYYYSPEASKIWPPFSRTVNSGLQYPGTAFCFWTASRSPTQLVGNGCLGHASPAWWRILERSRSPVSRSSLATQLDLGILDSTSASYTQPYRTIDTRDSIQNL
jgi:hypothetical protein